jgi:hypothetical protein
MIRIARRLSAPLAVWLGGLTILLPTAGAREIAPFRTALAVSWGEGAGSDAFRDDLSRTLAATFAGGCFASVVIVDHDPAPAAADLDFTVVLSKVLDETRFDDSIAMTLQPGEPAKELRRVARFEVTVDATLSARATGTLIRRKHLAGHVSRRPMILGEDPQATARAEVIDSIVADLARGLGCGGAKLTRKVRDALGGVGEAAPAPR